MDTTVVTPGGVLFPILVAVGMIVVYAVGYVITRGGEDDGETTPIGHDKATLDCKAACMAWQNQRLACCEAVRAAELAKNALDSAREDEKRAFTLWVVALALLFAVIIYQIPAWTIPAQIAVVAASLYWAYTKAIVATANADWLAKTEAAAEARNLEEQARAEVIRNCPAEAATACLSNPPCDL